MLVQAAAIAEVAEHDVAAVEPLLDACEATLRGGRQVVVTALGKNVPICEKFSGTLNSFGLAARFMHTNSAIHGDLGMLAQGDLLIIVSKSGKTEESVALARLVKQRPVETWALTCDGASSLAGLTQRVCEIGLDDEGDLWNLAPIGSSIVFLAVFNAIAVELSARLGITRADFLANHPGGEIGRIGRIAELESVAEDVAD